MKTHEKKQPAQALARLAQPALRRVGAAKRFRTRGALDAMAKKRSPARVVLVAFIVSAMLSASGCSEQRPDKERTALAGGELSGVVRVSGSGPMAPMIAEMAKDFQKLHPRVSIEVQASSSGRGYTDAKQGKLDIAMVSRVLPAEERELVPFLIARDGICVVIHSGNPVESLSQKQTADIYTKKIANWREVGGDDKPLYVIAAPLAAGSTELFLHYLRIKNADVRADFLELTIADRFAALAKNTSGILYSSLGEAERRTAAGEQVKILPMEGVPATRENLAAGRYPLARPLALVTRGLPSGTAKAFIDYARSPEATHLIERYEFVPYRD